MNIRHRTRRLRTVAVSSAAGLLALGMAAPAFAQSPAPSANANARRSHPGGGLFGSNSQRLETNLDSLNGSGTVGHATVRASGDGTVTVDVETDGASAGLPHAQHLHIGGRNVCPDQSDDANGDGVITTAEGQPAYGAINVSLTTTGDVSAQSGLAVDRMPTADADGQVHYSRTFELPAGVDAADLEDAVIVQHGISELSGDPTAFDGSAKSSVNPDLPLEATVPAVCGELHDDSLLGLGLLRLNLGDILGFGRNDGQRRGLFDNDGRADQSTSNRDQSNDGLLGALFG